jgi:hypothetical protein
MTHPENSPQYSVNMPSSSSNTTNSPNLSHVDEAGGDLGHSRNKQALLDQKHYHDAIATIPSTQVYGARAPQARYTEEEGAFRSTDDASPLNTFDRRHPQFNGNVRGPQDV